MTYIILFSFILSLVGHGCYTVWKIKKHLHMMQLNSYFNRRYLYWLYRKKHKVFSFRDLWPLIALIGIFFHAPLLVLVLFALVYFKLFYWRPSLPEKKPLVFTPRAIRLFVTNIVFLLILYLMLFGVWWDQGDFWFEIMLGVLVLYNFLVPIFLMLANMILVPLERAIQYWYFYDAYKYLRTLNELKVVGITGSFGKTTTKYILTELLRHKFHTLKTPGSYNTTMGVTKVIRQELKPIHDIFVVEMSAKKRGDIAEVCDLVKPQYGLITAIGEQHLETFKTLANIKKAKNELMESLPPDGTAFFNMDDINCQELVKLAKCNVITFGIDVSDVDYRVSDISIDENGSHFKVKRSKDNASAIFQTRLLGRHNICNILGAIAIASELGVEFKDMVYPLQKTPAVPHRLELKRVGKEIVFIDDAFNSNPVGSKMALEVLQMISGKRKIIITPGMVELGVKEDEYNERFGESIAEICGYVILVGKKQTALLQKGLETKKYPSDKLFIARDFAAAKEHLEQILNAGDVVLFENDLPDNYG